MKGRKWPTQRERRAAKLSAMKKYGDSLKGRRVSHHNHLKRTYGITLGDYDSLFALQRGCCAICLKPGVPRIWEDGRKEFFPLAVDHDHKTGRIRGLLCTRCNSAIGLFSDSLDVISAAMSYLKEHSN